MDHLSLTDARRIFGRGFVDPALVTDLLGGGAAPAQGPPISAADAEALAAAGCGCTWRTARTADGRPVTLALLHGLTAADRGRGLRGDDPWWIEQPAALGETPGEGWAVFHLAPLAATLNRTWDAAEAELRRHGAGRPWRRRRAVEIALDTLAAARGGERLLAAAWDWSTSPSTDGGLLNLGDFGPGGLDVIAYSKAVKHAALGVCPTLDLASR